MKKYLLVCILASITSLCLAADKVVYGSDDRVGVGEVTNPYLKTAMNSTAAMINWELLDIAGDSVKIKGESLELSLGVCSTERFAQEKTPATCSGFLVAEDILITAGHCMVTAEDCRLNAWVFDYTDNEKELSYRQSVYRCLKVLKQSYTDELDFAIVKLDRPTGREHLAYRQSSKIATGAKIAVVGFPSGLPMKVASNATVIDNGTQDYFTADLDTFGGNSGSVVVNVNEGVIEGILVRGQEDYIYSNQQGCYVVNHCPAGGNRECPGEDVTRITSLRIDRVINNFLASKELLDLIYKGNLQAVKNILTHDSTLLNQMLDQELTPLMAAMWSGNEQLVTYLLQQSSLNINTRSNLDFSAIEYGILTHDYTTLDMIEQLIQRDDFQVGQSSYSNVNAIMFAAKYGRYDVLASILVLPNINLEQQEFRSGNSALLYAAAANSIESFQLLLHHGADPLASNSENMNALMLVIERGNAKFTKYLLQLNIYNLAQKNISGDTAAHIAAKNSMVNKLKLLCKSGADFSIENNLSQTVWDILRIRHIDLAGECSN